MIDIILILTLGIVSFHRHTPAYILIPLVLKLTGVFKSETLSLSLSGKNFFQGQSLSSVILLLDLFLL